MSRCGSDAGFTLLEILVALAVFGFLSLGLAQGVDFGLRAWRRQAGTIAARSEMDAVDRALRQIVASLNPAAALSGRAHAAVFTAQLPAAAALATRDADMLLEVDADHRLLLRWRPHLHAKPLAAAGPYEESGLLQGVERLDLFYWPRGAAGWQTAWADASLPALVRMRLVFPPGDGRHWPDIVAAPARDPPQR